MMNARALLFALALAACGQAGDGKGANAPENAASDPFVMQIEIGRYDVMLQQARALTEERPGAGAEADPSEPAALARALRHVVWQFNLDRSRLCERGLFTDVACAPAYEPVWISEPASVAPTLEEIRSRSAAVGEEVTRFWDAVCEDARSRETNEEERRHLCAIE